MFDCIICRIPCSVNCLLYFLSTTYAGPVRHHSLTGPKSAFLTVSYLFSFFYLISTTL